MEKKAKYKGGGGGGTDRIKEGSPVGTAVIRALPKNKEKHVTERIENCLNLNLLQPWYNAGICMFEACVM